jgi:hypothetical protein
MFSKIQREMRMSRLNMGDKKGPLAARRPVASARRGMTSAAFAKHCMFWLAALACLLPIWAHAATAEEEARMKRCPEGHYQGPGTGASRFYQDPYIWFVTRDFAKRYCMPESHIDDSLKGALALAVRLRPEAFTLCGLFAGRSDQCPTKQELVMDVYVDNTKANIPKADPTVKFFIERPHSSGALVGPEGKRSDRRHKGETPDLEGEKRP